MLADNPQNCPIIKDLIMDVLVGHMFKGLPYLYLTLWLFRDVCSINRCSVQVLESWAAASSLTTFKLVWKTGTFLAVVTAKCCSGVTLLCIDNQHLFLQHNAAIFIPVSGSKSN